MPTDEECLIELYHTCKSILFKHGGDPEAAKKYIRQVFSAAGEKHCEETHEMFLKAIDLIHDLEKKESVQHPHRPKRGAERTKHSRNRPLW